MGSPLGPLLANTSMCSIEEKLEEKTNSLLSISDTWMAHGARHHALVQGKNYNDTTDLLSTNWVRLFHNLKQSAWKVNNFAYSSPPTPPPVQC